MVVWLLIAAALAAQSVEAPDALAKHAWWQFSRSPALIGGGETVDVSLAPKDPQTNALSYTMRLRRVRGSGTLETLWADSRTCPAVRQVLEAMRRLAVPRPVVEGMETEGREIVMDGATYRLRTRARFGRGADDVMELQSNVETPLADWIDGSFKALEPCWSPAEPARPK